MPKFYRLITISAIFFFSLVLYNWTTIFYSHIIWEVIKSCLLLQSFSLFILIIESSRSLFCDGQTLFIERVNGTGALSKHISCATTYYLSSCLIANNQLTDVYNTIRLTSHLPKRNVESLLDVIGCKDQSERVARSILTRFLNNVVTYLSRSPIN